MGVLIVVIAYAVQSPGSFPLFVPLAALPIGGLVAAILLANNIRDMNSDRRGGRRTLPIVLGREVGVLVYRVLLLEAYVAAAALMALRIVPLECALVFLSASAALRLWRDIGVITTPERLDPVVKRSEEHTSELQSRQYLVCRLLLEKKRNNSAVFFCRI